jgi:hypothetical protein
MLSRLRARRPTPAFVISCIALFVSLSGVAYAANTIRSRDIVNDAVTTADIKGGGGRTGDVKNRDVNKSLAVAKGFATVDASPGNGGKPILNGGGQQTANLPGGIGATRTGTGQYTVAFNANTGTGKFSGVDNLSDLATQVTSRDTAYGDAAVIATGSSANENQVILRVQIRNNANTLIDRDFSIQFYANE